MRKKSSVNDGIFRTRESKQLICIGYERFLNSFPSYIHYGWLQPSRKDSSHTTCVVCINFIHEWRALKFYSRFRTTNFWETFYCKFICSEFLAAERKSSKLYFSHFVLLEVWNMASHLISQHSRLHTRLWRLHIHISYNVS